MTGLLPKQHKLCAFPFGIVRSYLDFLLSFDYSLKDRSHEPISRIRFLLVQKIGSCEHSKNDPPAHRSVIFKKRIEMEHALFSSDTLLGR